MSRLFEHPAHGVAGARRWPYALATLALVALFAGLLLSLRQPRTGGREVRAPASVGPVVTPRASVTPRGELEVSADVPGALVLLDGRRLGTAPQRLELDAGAYRVRVVSDGRLPFEREVQVVPGVATRLAARLAVAPPLLRVVSDVPGASVFVDREYLGTTPLETHEVGPGTHRLNVSAEGYEMHAETLELSDAPRTVEVRFKQLRLDVAADVVHRHGLGSCRGALKARPQGVHFEAERRDHSFEARLDAIAELAVDYLKKNLRLRLRGGRVYNFTVEGPSADPLLRFQQQVDAARLRLE